MKGKFGAHELRTLLHPHQSIVTSDDQSSRTLRHMEPHAVILDADGQSA